MASQPRNASSHLTTLVAHTPADSLQTLCINACSARWWMPFLLSYWHHDNTSGTDCDQQTPHTTSHHILALSLASVRSSMQDQQPGSHYLMIFE